MQWEKCTKKNLFTGRISRLKLEINQPPNGRNVRKKALVTGRISRLKLEINQSQCHVYWEE